MCYRRRDRCDAPNLVCEVCREFVDRVGELPPCAVDVGDQCLTPEFAIAVALTGDRISGREKANAPFSANFMADPGDFFREYGELIDL